MEQATLTEFYTAKKRPIEGTHPAKRRKVVQTESVRVTRQRTRRTEAKSAPKRGKTRKTSRSNEPSSISNTPVNLPEVPQTAALDAFINAKMKASSQEPVFVTEQVTSVDDDHESIGISFKQTTSQRPRKSVQKSKLKPQSGDSSIDKKEQLTSQKSDKNSEPIKEQEQISNKKRSAKQRNKESETTPSNANDATVKKLEGKEEGKNPSATLPKSPIKSVASSGMKINPWISDQANRVLLSRGQTALLLSQEKRAALSKDVISSKKISKEVQKSVHSKTKAQEGLGKARELIKKMRSLESDASNSKVSMTIDNSERLHKLAKRKSNEVASAGPASRLAKPPAYERLHSLAQPKEQTLTLPLPYKYKILGELFNACDTILNLMGQRKETCTFEKLKESVQQMSRKRFEKKNLSQFIALLSNSYDVQQVRKNTKSSVYDLTIQFGPTVNSKEGRLTIPTSELLSRRKVFHECLLALTKRHHQVFLKSLEVPLSIDDDKINRWHPQFKLDEVPDVKQSLLPEAPVVKTYTSAQDVLDRGCGLVAPRVEKALRNVALKASERPKLDITYDSQPKGEENRNTKQNKALKGVSQELLNKIRQKEARKLEEKMMRDPVVDKKMVMQQRLPELCRILKTYFTAEKKAAIPLEDATIKLSESYKSSLTPVQVEEHLKLLSELAPEWLTVLSVRKCPYIKINKKADINNVIKSVSQKEIK